MDKEFLIGVEVTSKTINTGLVDLSGKIVKRFSIPTEMSKGKRKVVDNICVAINKVKKSKVIGVGVSVPGMVNRDKGVVITSPFPGWNNLSLKRMIEEQLRVPVYVENEGKCFTIAEYKCGAFRKTENTIGVLFNNTISSGIIIDGRLAKGTSSAAGSLSFSIIDNKKGNLEDYASPAAIERQFKAKTRKAKPISEIINLDNKASKDVLKNAGIYFGITMAHLVNALNPELIIVGGALAKSEQFIEAAEKSIQMKAHELCSKRVKIIGSKLNDSAILGAASIVA